MFFCRLVEQHHRGGSQGAGIDAELVSGGELGVHQLTVDQRLGAGNRILFIVAHQHRLRDEAQIHGAASQLQRGSLSYLGLLCTMGGPSKDRGQQLSRCG